MHQSSMQALTSTTCWIVITILFLMTVGSSPIVYLSHGILPTNHQKVIIADAQTKERKGSSNLVQSSFAKSKIPLNSHSRSHALLMMMKKRSINTEASMAASSAASSATKEVYHMATSHATEMQASKLYNAKQVGGLATMAGLTGIGIGSSAHAGLNKVPKHVAVHHYRAHRKH